MKSRLALATLVVFLTAAGSAAAAGPGEAGQWGAELKFRYGWPKAQDGGTELFDSSYGGEVMVTRRMADRWSIGAGYNYVWMEATPAFQGDYFVEYGIPENNGYRQQAVFALARYDIHEGALNPFLALGIGASEIHHTQGGGGFDGWGTDLIARFGMIYMLGDSFGIVGEINYDVLMGDETDVKTMALMVGANYGF